MTTYIRDWLFAQTPAVSVPAPPSIVESSPPGSDDEDGETVHGDDDDLPPAFPSLNSAQRASAPGSGNIPSILTDTQLMPPPPAPSLAARKPGVPSSSRPGPSLAVPLTTTKPPPKAAKRAKVALAPGHGPLDWANLKKSGQDLRGVDTMQRVTPSMLKEHRTRDDAWSAFNGKVYNMSAYMPYHPGGEKELMRVAGRDGTKLFASTHAWVNIDYMLDECLVGFMVSES